MMNDSNMEAAAPMPASHHIAQGVVNPVDNSAWRILVAAPADWHLAVGVADAIRHLHNQDPRAGVHLVLEDTPFSARVRYLVEQAVPGATHQLHTEEPGRKPRRKLMRVMVSQPIDAILLCDSSSDWAGFLAELATAGEIFVPVYALDFRRVEQ